MSQPIELRFNELLEGSRSDLVLKIYGEDLETLQGLSERSAEILSQVEGAGNPEPEIRGKVPMIRVRPDMQMLNSLGLSRKEVLDTMEMGMGGLDAGYLYRGVRRHRGRNRSCVPLQAGTGDGPLQREQTGSARSCQGHQRRSRIPGRRLVFEGKKVAPRKPQKGTQLKGI